MSLIVILAAVELANDSETASRRPGIPYHIVPLYRGIPACAHRATWCGPCIEEFQNLEGLKEHFKDSKEVDFLYLSIDKDYSNRNNTINKWKKFVNLYNLKGIHFMANKNLYSAIHKKFGSPHKGGHMLSIPRYIIINKEGEVVEGTAKRPSDKDALYKQIEQFL